MTGRQGRAPLHVGGVVVAQAPGKGEGSIDPTTQISEDWSDKKSRGLLT